MGLMADMDRIGRSQHKSSTANFKHSRRKLNDLGRLIAGRGVDESILQLTVSRLPPTGFAGTVD